MQTELQFTPVVPNLERFLIPRSSPEIRYGHVSRQLHQLWRFGRRAEAAELAKAAGEVFNEPHWPQRYPAPKGEQANG